MFFVIKVKLYAFIVASFLPFVTIGSDDLQAVFLKGLKYSLAGQYSLAVKEYRGILSFDPALERPRLELAYNLFKLKDYKGAEFHFKKVLATVKSEKVKANIRNFLSQIRQNLPQLNLTIGFVSDTNPSQETSEKKVTIGGMEFNLGTTSNGGSKSGYEINVNAKIPISVKDKTFVRANLEYTDYSGRNNEKSFLSTSYGRHLTLNSHSSITPELGLHRFIHNGNTLYSGKNISINYFNAFSDSANVELDYKLLDYEYPDYSHMNGRRNIITAKTSKLISQDNSINAQLSTLNSNSVDKTNSYRQSSLNISNTRDFNGGWSIGLTGAVNKKNYFEVDPFFGLVRKDKEKYIELTILNSLMSIQGMSPKLSFGKVINASNIDLYKFDRAYSKVDLVKEF